MASVEDLIKTLGGINVDALTDAIIEENQEEITSLNKERLREGKNIDGSIVGYYTLFTENIARKSNPRKPKRAGEPYNFEWTGSLFDSMKSIELSNKLSIYNSINFGSLKQTFITDKKLLGFSKSDEDFVNWELLPKHFRTKINELLSKIR